MAPTISADDKRYIQQSTVRLQFVSTGKIPIGVRADGPTRGGPSGGPTGMSGLESAL